MCMTRNRLGGISEMREKYQNENMLGAGEVQLTTKAKMDAKPNDKT